MSFSGNPQMSTETFERHEDKEFATGLFDFTEDLNTFVKALFLPCLVYARNKQSLNNTGSITPDLLLYCCGIDLCCCGATAAIAASARGDLRETKNIQGSFMNDCLVHCFCGPCALVQEKREIEFLKGQ